MPPITAGQPAQRIVCRAPPSQRRHRYFAGHRPKSPEDDVLQRTGPMTIPNRLAFSLNRSRLEHEIRISHWETYMSVIWRVLLPLPWGLWMTRGYGKYRGKNVPQMRKGDLGRWAWDTDLELHEKSPLGIPGLSHTGKEYTYSPLNMTAASSPRPD